MNIDMKNFRKSSDLILKDIHVTDDLKRKTLKKCIDKRPPKAKLPLVLAISFSIVLMFSSGVLMHFFNRSDALHKSITRSINQDYKNKNSSPGKNNKVQESSKAAGSNNLRKPGLEASNSDKVSINGVQNKTAVSNDLSSTFQDKNMASNYSGGTPQDKNMGKMNENADAAVQNKSITGKLPENNTKNKACGSNDNNVNAKANIKVSSSLASSSEQLASQNVEKYFGSKILFPSYIPDGFKLTKISIPDDKIKCVELEYSSSSDSFQILQNKNLSKSEEKSNISIGNNAACISSVRDEKTNVTTTNVTWTKDNIQYSLSGTLPQDSITKIAESLN